MEFKALTRVTSEADSHAWVEHIKGSTIQSVPPLVEFIVDAPVMKVILQDLMGRPWVDYGTERSSQAAYLDNLIAFWHFMGYDYVRFEYGLGFEAHSISTRNTAAGMTGDRSWVNEHVSVINSMEELASHQFPSLAGFDFFPFEYLNHHLPEGMGLILSHGGGFLETLTWTLSMEGLFFKLYDQPELVAALMDIIGNLQLGFYNQIVTLDRLVAIFPGDDMGFRSATLIKPSDLRKYIFPWHQKVAKLAHDNNLLYLLHSCGNLASVMDDLVDVVKIDGRHSYEDAIMPVEQFYDRYGIRLAVLGGMDIDYLATASPDEIRSRTRHHMETCNRGRFAIGSGNSIPDYVPVENYLAMVDEALFLRKNHV